MQQPAPSQPSSSPSSFAGLLATLASPPPDAAADAPLWNASDLGEDVATLSYASALEAHARYRPLRRDSDRADKPLTQEDNPRRDVRTDVAIQAGVAAAVTTADAAPRLQSNPSLDRGLRSASVTIRLSKAECARLHQRANEAGLTVSAYLRSCALEAETLRAQVKQALAELKAGTAGPKGQEGKKLGRRSFLVRIAQVIMRRR